MSFVDLLRMARSSPAAAFHEFKLDYSPQLNRVYAFFEGHEDASFYVTFLQLYVNLRHLKVYRCGNKRTVYQTFELVTKYYPSAPGILFFVDKDLSDFLGESWPVDPRIFITEVYSIENYIVCSEVLERYYREFIRLSGVTFDFGVVLKKFEEEMARFHVIMGLITAWIIAERRAGQKPNLGNIQLTHLVDLTDDMSVIPARKESRLVYLRRVTGVVVGVPTWRRVRVERKSLLHIHPKTYVRGKFEAWFLLEFIRKLERNLRELAAEVGGSVQVRTVLHADNFVEILAPRLSIPKRIREFLEIHLLPKTS
jgi:uncharacterized protein DUF4435